MNHFFKVLYHAYLQNKMKKIENKISAETRRRLNRKKISDKLNAKYASIKAKVHKFNQENQL